MQKQKQHIVRVFSKSKGDHNPQFLSRLHQFQANSSHLSQLHSQSVHPFTPSVRGVLDNFTKSPQSTGASLKIKVISATPVDVLTGSHQFEEPKPTRTENLNILPSKFTSALCSKNFGRFHQVRNSEFKFSHSHLCQLLCSLLSYYSLSLSL